MSNCNNHNKFDVEMRVEIPYGSKVKYEIKAGDKLVVDRVLHTPMPYPFNYGYIDNTLAEDGDALDIVLLGDTAFDPRCYINVRIIGALEMSDEKGRDVKVISVPAQEIDPRYAHINSLEDLSSHELEQIRFFFENYKKLEKGKTVTVDAFMDQEKAWQVFGESQAMYQNKVRREARKRTRTFNC